MAASPDQDQLAFQLAYDEGYSAGMRAMIEAASDVDRYLRYLETRGKTSANRAMVAEYLRTIVAEYLKAVHDGA